MARRNSGAPPDAFEGNCCALDCLGKTLGKLQYPAPELKKAPRSQIARTTRRYKAQRWVPRAENF
jgi:hypothetical protein